MASGVSMHLAASEGSSEKYKPRPKRPPFSTRRSKPYGGFVSEHKVSVCVRACVRACVRIYIYICVCVCVCLMMTTHVKRVKTKERKKVRGRVYIEHIEILLRPKKHTHSLSIIHFHPSTHTVMHSFYINLSELSLHHKRLQMPSRQGSWR